MSGEVAELERVVGGLPDGWRSLRLGDVADISRGTSWANENERRDPVDGAHPVLGIRNVQAHLEIDDLLWLHGLKPSAIASSTVQTGDILMVGSNGNPARIGNAVQVDEPGRYLYASLLFGLRPRREAVDPDFLYYAIIAPGVQTVISDAVQGTTGLSNLKITTLRDLSINLPPPDEQRRIAEVLRSVDEAIAAAKEAADQTRVLQSLLTTDRCFGHGFDMVSLGDIMTDIRYGTSVKCDAGDADGHPVLRIPNVVNGRVELDDLKYAAVSDADLRRFSLDVGDVVVVRTNGNPAYIGRSALIEDGAGQFLFASYLIRMRFDDQRAWAPYVFAALNSHPVRQKLLKAATTSAGNYNINTKSLSSITIPLPDLETQHQIGTVIRAATDTAVACDNEVSRKRQIKADLMSDLLSGHVRVPA